MDKEKLTKQIEALIEEDNPISQVVGLLGMDDESFETIAPPILDEFKRSMNKPAERLSVVQMFNASGVQYEDLMAELAAFYDELDKNESLSSAKKDFLKEMLGTISQAIAETDGIAKRIIPIAVELCHPDAKMPEYAHDSDSGMDVFALDDYTIHPGETILIPTGIKMAIPPGYEIQVRPKSGRALKTKLRIANTPGTIDAGYRDEIKVIIDNIEPPIKDCGSDGTLYGSDYYIEKGQKFCQFVLSEVPKASLYQVNNVLDVDSNNRNGGFGSSGLYAKESE